MTINKQFIPQISLEDNRTLRNIFGNFHSREEIVTALSQHTDYTELRKKFEEKQKIHIDAKIASELRFKLTAQVLSDLLNTGWQISLSRKGFLINNGKAISNFNNRDEEKASLRESHLRSRNKVIGSKNVQAFISSMETKREFKGKEYSILDLIDDGKDLHAALADCKKNKKNFDEVMKVEIVPIFPSDDLRFTKKIKKCPITDIKYKDIWRYFRLTWATEYTSRPAREFSFLIRNAARENKPIMGIAMLSSSAIGHEARDNLIGWHNEEALRKKIIAKEIDIKTVVTAMLKVVDNAIEEIYKKDFKFLTKKLTSHPTEEIMNLLADSAKLSAEQRIDNLKAVANDEVEIDANEEELNNKSTEYKRLALEPLFKKKRALSLIKLLRVRRLFNEVELEKKPAYGYARLRHPSCRGGKTAISLALSKLKEQRNNINIMELSTCGGIAPYSTLLSGKLVTLLMASREVRDAVKHRYSGQVVLIRSKLAGKEIKSPPVILKAITTTSLYGASSQYNRLKLLPNNYEIDDTTISNKLINPVQWQEIKGEKSLSQGIGTYHFSPETSILAHIVSIAESGYRSVNSIMGEGTSPKLRNLRTVIRNIIDLDHPNNTITSEDFMGHGVKRKNYVCLLEENVLESLMKDKKNTSKQLNTVDAITGAWINRWLINRIDTKADAVKKFTVEEISNELRSHRSSISKEEDASQMKLI